MFGKEAYPAKAEAPSLAHVEGMRAALQRHLEANKAQRERTTTTSNSSSSRFQRKGCFYEALLRDVLRHTPEEEVASVLFGKEEGERGNGNGGGEVIFCHSLLTAVAQFELMREKAELAGKTGAADCSGSEDEGEDALSGALLEPREEHFYVAERLLPVMLDTVAQWHQLFPDGVPILSSPGRVVLTKRQCFAVISAGFLCLFPRLSSNCIDPVKKMPSINFIEMFTPRASTQFVAKIVMALHYIDETARRIGASDCRMDSDEDAVVFERMQRSLQQLDAAMDRPLLPPVMHPLKASIDSAIGMLRVDFANCVIGGASLAYGCVQEEIMFSEFAEMNVARLIMPPMKADEAIAILRAEQFSIRASGTYGFRLRCGGAFEDGAARASSVTCIDASDYRYQPLGDQYTAPAIDRDVLKAFAGFNISSDVVPAGVPVATGNWGCGAFRGDPHLKIFLQWAAAGAAGRAMHYFPFDEEELGRAFPPVAERLVQKGLTCRQLLQWLKAKNQSQRTRKYSAMQMVAMEVAEREVEQ